MTIMDACCLLEKYAECPECGSIAIGSEKGTIEVDTKSGYFKRTCKCGWFVEIKGGGN